MCAFGIVIIAYPLFCFNVVKIINILSVVAVEAAAQAPTVARAVTTTSSTILT